MNNLTYGAEGFSVYETQSGGSGAGPWWEGTSAVQYVSISLHILPLFAPFSSTNPIKLPFSSLVPAHT